MKAAFLKAGRMRRRDFMAGSAATAALGVAGWPVYAEINVSFASDGEPLYWPSAQRYCNLILTTPVD